MTLNDSFAVNTDEREQIELTLLLEALALAYGYDFRKYARASIERRLKGYLEEIHFKTAGELISVVLDDASLAHALIQQFSVPVTEMFRDPRVYARIRENVFPLLRTWPFSNIWHAGCASGEEVYSLAILLREEGLLDRVNLYGTDFNEQVLEKARLGIYAAADFRDATSRYQEAGGQAAFSDYYNARYASAIMASDLRSHVSFSRHNLTTDGVFGEMQMILCRNVLIYFNEELRERTLHLLNDSLVRGGFLCLGRKESLRFSAIEDRYEVIDERASLYRKKPR